MINKILLKQIGRASLFLFFGFLTFLIFYGHETAKGFVIAVVLIFTLFFITGEIKFKKGAFYVQVKKE